MDKYLEYLVTEADELDRIDRFLATKDEQLSRSIVKKLIDEDHVFVNEVTVKPSYKVKVDDFIEVDEVSLLKKEIIPTKMDLDIVYEDDDVLVVNKPSGVVVHPAPGHIDDTLVNGLMYHINQLSTVNGEMRPGIVHRIDKDTSGLLMIAKTNQAHMILADELKAKKTERTYIALVEGIIKNKRGKIDAPIGRAKHNRLKMDVVATGKPAVTHFEVLETYQHQTLIRCRLETGRTHQIRVHLAYIKHPVVGDFVYGNASVNPFGQMLHAKTLGFTHPTKNQWMLFDSELPKTFQTMLERLRSNL